MNDHDAERLKKLLRDSLPAVADTEPERDLWPAIQQRLRDDAPPAARASAVPWFDWALAGGLAVFALASPAAIPVLLYYL